MHTPKSPHEENSPQDENSGEELEAIFNPATQNKPQFAMDEEEWLDLHSIIEPQYNPVTMSLVDPDDED